MKAILILSICIGMMLILSGCTKPAYIPVTPQPSPGTPAVTTPVSALANPAAVYCTEKNYGYEIRKYPDGGEYGVCILPGGIECEEWAYYHGDCPAVSIPATTPGTALANPAAVFCESKNYTYRIVTNPDGSQSGNCVFPSGKACEGWAYYRGECNETAG